MTEDFMHLLSRSTRAKALQKYNEMETVLIQLTGHNMEKLIELFAAGYTLEPPQYLKLSIADMCEEEK